MLTQVACPQCGAGNRLPSRKDFSQGKCGACGASLSLDAPVEADDRSFERHLTMTKGPVIVDVWAPWCGPCRMMAPNYAAAAGDLAGEVRLLKLNADENETASRLGVRSIPALIMFVDGREVARQAGLMSREGVAAWVRTRLPAASAQ